MVIEMGSAEELLPSTPSWPLTVDMTEHANPTIVSPTSNSPATPRIRNPVSPSRSFGGGGVSEQRNTSDESTSVESVESTFLEEPVYDGSSRNFHLSPVSLFEEEIVEDTYDDMLLEIMHDETSEEMCHDDEESSEKVILDHQSQDRLDEIAVAPRSIPTEMSYDNDSEPGGNNENRNKTDRMTVIEEVDSIDETSTTRDYDFVDTNNATKITSRSDLFFLNHRVSDAEVSSPESFGAPRHGNAPFVKTLDPMIMEITTPEPISGSIRLVRQHHEPKNSTSTTPAIVDVTGPVENSSTVIPSNESPLVVQDSQSKQAFAPTYFLPTFSNSESDTSWPRAYRASRAGDPPANTNNRGAYFDQVKEVPGDAVVDRDYYFCQVEEFPSDNFASGVTGSTALGAIRQLNDDDAHNKPVYFQDASEVEGQIAYDELNSYNFMFEEQHPGSGDEEEVILEQVADEGDPEAAFMEAYSNEDYLEDDNEKEVFIDEDTPNSTESNRSFWILLLFLILLFAAGLALWILLVDNESDAPDGPLKYEVLSGPFMGDPSTGFGGSIALDGDVLVVGLPASENGEMQSYMLENMGSPSMSSTISGEENGSGFGWSVDITGTVAIVGAPFLLIEDTPTPGGGVSVYSYSDSAWIQVDTTIRGDEDVYAANEAFGWSVAVAVTETFYRVVVGAPLSNLKGFDVGRVYTFEKALTGASPWFTMEVDPLIGERTGDRFGSSVAISKDGTTFIAGSPGGDLHDHPGKTFVYKYNAFDWELVFAIGGFENNERLGASVAILSNDGDVFAIGAPNYEEGSGRVAVFRKSFRGLYAQVGADIVGESGDKIGEKNLMDGSVSTTGIHIVVATAHGKIRRYDYVVATGNWTMVYDELPSGNVSSLSVSGSGASSIAIGTSDGEVTVYGPSFEFEGQILPLTPSQPQ